MTFQTEYAALHGRNGCFGMMAFSRTWLVYSLLQFLEEMGEIKSGPQSGTEALKLRLGVVRRSGDIKSDLDVTLEAWTPRIRGHFVSVWAVGHRTVCALRRPDGSICSCWVVDGHMKARRVVCDNTLARFIDVPGLGRVVFGCLHTPKRKSRFCVSCGEGAAFCVVPEGYEAAVAEKKKAKGGGNPKRLHRRADAGGAPTTEQPSISGTASADERRAGSSSDNDASSAEEMQVMEASQGRSQEAEDRDQALGIQDSLHSSGALAAANAYGGAGGSMPRPTDPSTSAAVSAAGSAPVDAMQCSACEEIERPAPAPSVTDGESDAPPDEYEDLPDKAKQEYLVSGALARRNVLKRHASVTCRAPPATWKKCQAKKHSEYQLTFVGYEGSWWVCQCDMGDAVLARAKVEVAALELAAAGGTDALAAAKVARAEELRAARAAKRSEETAEWRAFHEAKAEQEAERLARERALQADPRRAKVSARTRSGRAATSSEPALVAPPEAMPLPAEPPHAGEFAADPERKDGGDFDSTEGSALAAAVLEVPCSNLKENQYADMKKRTTAGVLATVSSCGLFLCVDELAVAESLKQVHQSMHSMLSTPGIELPKVLAYDDACHLHAFWHRRRESSPWVNWLLGQVELVVDRFHFRNHNAKYCRKFVDPHKCEALRFDDNTEAAESSFAWLARSKHIFRTMNESRFLFTILRLMHMRNRYTAKLLFHPAE